MNNLILLLAKPSEFLVPFERLHSAISTFTVSERADLRTVLSGLPYREFLLSAYWRSVRAEVIRRQRYTCQKCRGGRGLEVHHSSYANHGNEHAHLEDLRLLCWDCHDSTQREFNAIKSALGSELTNQLLSHVGIL